MDSEQSPCYPVLCIRTGKGHCLHFARQVDELVICSNRALKSGFYTGLRIIDSRGNRYEVLEARKTANAGVLWGFKLLGSQRIRVALRLEKLLDEQMADLKPELLRFIDTIEMYDASPEIRRVIRKATDFSEMISTLADNFYRKY